MSELELNLEMAASICQKVLAAFYQGASNWPKYRGQESAYDKCAREANRRVARGDSVQETNDFHENVCVPQKPRLQQEVGALRRAYREALRSQFNAGQLQWTNEKQVELVAGMAEQKHLGNCQEMAAKAWLFLRDDETVSVYVMSVDVPYMEDTHVFVVIGRSGGEDRDPGSWGRSAVVCDPWSQGLRNDPAFGAYPAARLDEKFKELFGARLGSYGRPYERTHRKRRFRRETVMESGSGSRAHLGWSLRR